MASAVKSTSNAGTALGASICVLLTWSSACRHFDVCGGGREPCPEGTLPLGRGAGGAPPELPTPRAGASSEAGAGAAVLGSSGAAGAAPADACTWPKLECDESSLTACETDVARDPAHCGECRQECEGLCTSGACTPFELVAGSLHTPQSALCLTRDDVFLIASAVLGASEGADLIRVSRASGATQVVARGVFDSEPQLVASGTRLYVLDWDEVWSVPLAGGDLRAETFSADALATHHGRLYFTNEGALYVASGEGEHALVHDVAPATPLLAADDQILVLGTRDMVDDDWRYQLFLESSSGGEAVSIADGSGRLIQVLVQDGEPFWLVEGAERGLELHRRDGPSLALGGEDAPSEMSVTSELLVMPWTRAARHGLDLVPLLAPDEARKIETLGELSTLKFAEKQLWFFDSRRRALVRTDPGALYRLSGTAD